MKARDTFKLAALAAALAAMQAGQAKPIDQAPEISSPTTDASASSASKGGSIFGNASKSGSASGTGAGAKGSSPKGSSIFGDALSQASNAGQAGNNTISFVNGNSNSSNGIFTRRFGAQQGSGQGSGSTPMAEQERDMPQGDVNIKDLQTRLRDTQKELSDTQIKLRQTEEAYGAMPLDQDGNASPESMKSDIPSVPKSVMTGSSGGGRGISPRLTVTPGVNQVITISADQPNRIITPFKHPQILSSALEVGDGKSCKEVCVKDSVVYISTKKEYPIGLFITDKDKQQTALSVTLVPRRIPPREVTLELADTVSLTALNSGSEEALAWETSQPFVDTVKKTMKDLALGSVPSGYTLGKIPAGYSLPTCTQPGLQFSFKGGQLVAGSNLNYVVGKITNVGQKEIEFKEASCGGYDVAAVAAFPYNLLRPGESTEVYVVQRAGKAAEAGERRRPLIGGGR